MIIVKKDEFESFVRAINQDDLSVGRDVGRNHGIVCYYSSGKHVATERWALADRARQFTYEIAKS